MKKMLFIMNPFAGQRKANKVLPEILMTFTQAGYDVTAVMTTGPGSASATAQRLGGEVDLVVCCGGDGTLNETITGLNQAEIQVPVGYIPAGTTNDFASSLKLSHNPVQAAKDIMEGEVKSYDLGQFEDRYFTYVASFGAFTRSSYVVPQNIKNALGHRPMCWEAFPSCPRSVRSISAWRSTEKLWKTISCLAPSATPPPSAAS